MIKLALSENGIDNNFSPTYKDFRAGDVKHSQADISKAVNLLGYSPEWHINDGVNVLVPWCLEYQDGQQ